MEREPVQNIQDDVSMMSLETSLKPDHEDESQEHCQHNLKAESSLSPWSSMADTNEFWPSEYNETFEPVGLESFNYGSEPAMPGANHGYGGIDLPEFANWNYDDEEMERGDHDIVPGHCDLSPGPIDSQAAEGDVPMDASHASLESPINFAPYQQATERPTDPFEEIGAQFMPGSPTDLARPTNHLSIPLPRVIVSDTDIGNVGDGKKDAVSEVSTDTLSTAIQSDAKQNLGQDLYRSVASNGSSSQLQDLNSYGPTNYEIAMHDRKPPYTVIGGIEPRLSTLAAETANAFYADADLTTPKVAPVTNIDQSFGVKRRRLPTNLPTLQTPSRTPPGLQHWQSSSVNAVRHSPSLNGLQTPKYPTPPSSFKGTAEYHHMDSAYRRNNLPSTPVTPVCINPVELPSPVSPSPSNLSDVADGITHCASCPDRIFRGKDQRTNLQRHMRDFHKGMPRLECLVQGCTASFAPGRKDNRIKHVRAMHPDYPLPAPSKKRKREADGGFESC